MINPTPQRSQTDPILGTTVSHYTVLRKIGEGGMGAVYEAQDTRLNRHVALKFISEQLAQDKATIQRFRREACAASALNHPNICTVHDIGAHQGRHFLVMELLAGKTLKDLIEGPMKLKEILSIGAQIAEALDAAHAEGITHRDIKPANIFVTNQGVVKVLDFGLAKLARTSRTSGVEVGTSSATGSTDDSTVPGAFVGTAAYMSPEQARGALLDWRTDVFSFGVVLYEMSTGFRPFRGDTSASLYDAILNSSAIPATQLNPSLPAALDSIIGRALEKDRTLRYQSASEIKTDLIRLGTNETDNAVPATQAPAAPMNLVLLYRREVEPDNQVLQLLESVLVEQGYNVFLDRHLTIGMEWATEIEHRIASADAVIALLSSASVCSEMLSYEIHLAHEYAQKQGGKPRLLPVRVNLEGPLPDFLTGILDGKQYASWNGPQDNGAVVSGIVDALQSPLQKFMRPVRLEAVGGAIPLDSRFYIVRPTDDDFRNAIARHDSIILIKGARQMGKTSLMARGLNEARAAGARIVLTDLQKLNSSHLQTAETFFMALMESVSEQLDLDINLERTWNPQKGPSTNFERLLRREILSKVHSRLVWGLDEVDRLFSCGFASEVFGLFRSWHNERSLDPDGPWQKFTLVIAYATEAHLFITDVNQSPFNVGTRLVLGDFTFEQVRELNQRYGSPLTTIEELEKFFELLWGQPYLTQKGLNEMVAHRLDFNGFLSIATKDEGPYGDHLRRILVSLIQDSELLEVVRSVLNSQHSSTPDAFYRLRSSGIVSGDSAKEMKLRCQLYQIYLSRHLL